MMAVGGEPVPGRAPHSYLDSLPGGLRRALVSGRCIPIVGAGMSATARSTDGRKPPSWSGLGDLIAADLDGTSGASPLDAISSYSHTYGRVALVERLTELLLIDEVEPSDAHNAFAQLPFDTVITTNVDFLLEDAFKRQNRPYVTLVGESQLAIQRRPATTNLLKFHGDLRHPDQLVMTEEDYDGFLRRNALLATYLSWYLLTRDPIFIGYSLDDADFREILAFLRERLGRMSRSAWVLLPTDRHDQAAKFERRGIRPVVLERDKEADRAGVLTRFFNELGREWASTTARHIDARSDAATAELRREPIAPQLALFVAGTSTLALYRDFVFPAVMRTGFLPIGIDEIHARDPEIAPMAINLALSKAGVVIYDTGRSTPYSRDYVASRRGNQPIIYVDSIQRERALDV